MNLKIGILQILLELAPEINRGVLQLRNLHPGVMLILSGRAEILYNVVSLPGKCPVDIHSSFGISLGQLEEVTEDVDQSLVQGLEKSQQVQDKEPKHSDGDFIFRLILHHLLCVSIQSRDVLGDKLTSHFSKAVSWC